MAGTSDADTVELKNLDSDTAITITADVSAGQVVESIYSVYFRLAHSRLSRERGVTPSLVQRREYL